MNNVMYVTTSETLPLLTYERACKIMLDMVWLMLWTHFVASQNYNNAVSQRTSTNLPPIAANGVTLPNLSGNTPTTRAINHWATVSLPSIKPSTLIKRDLAEISNESSIDDGYKPPRLSVIPALFAQKLQDRSLHSDLLGFL